MSSFPDVGKRSRIVAMLAMTGGFFLVELVVGYLYGSMALVADSFHMLSDVMSLIVALYAINLGRRRKWTPQLTFGWQRAEILGALINGVFLLSMCFSISIEAFQRFFEPIEIERPVLILIVGGVGLGINLIGLFLFHEHSHFSENSHEDRRNSDMTTNTQNILSGDIALKTMQNGTGEISSGVASRDASKEENSPTKFGNNHAHSHDTHSALNIKGVFLHILGDALGSVAVIISGLVIWLSTWNERFIIDPILSLVIVIIILFSTVPMVKSACMILLQATPSRIPVEEVRQAMFHVEGVLGIHDFHIWQLSDTKIVASVHVLCIKSTNFMKLAKNVKGLLHEYGIHSATVQPEYLNIPDNSQEFESSRQSSPSGSVLSDDETMAIGGKSCLLPCAETSCVDRDCCSFGNAESMRKRYTKENI